MLIIEYYEWLAYILAEIQGKFLLTINDHEAMWELFSGFSIEKIEDGYSV